jgi:hypothetical protein
VKESEAEVGIDLGDAPKDVLYLLDSQFEEWKIVVVPKNQLN